MSTRILVTGHQGYIGSVMAPMLHEQGFDVVGVDTGYYSDCHFVPDRTAIPTIERDIRDLQVDDLRGFDAVIHLAALSNDPIGNLNSRWTEDINLEGSTRLARMAKQAGVSRFLFSSSCIMYGLASLADVDEEAPLAPQTTYAESKVKAEQLISALAGDDFSPTFLRNGTVYGVSPRMRFDTAFNSLLGSAVATGKVVVFSDGTPWRPVVHVEDVTRAFMTVVTAPRELVHNQAFNVGADSLNYQISELAEMAASIVPGCGVEFRSQPDADQRTYRTSFAKLRRTFPSFRIKWNVRSAGESMYEDFRRIGLDRDLFFNPQFTRLSWLRRLLEKGRLDGDLRWSTAAVAS